MATFKKLPDWFYLMGDICRRYWSAGDWPKNPGYSQFSELPWFYLLCDFQGSERAFLRLFSLSPDIVRMWPEHMQSASLWMPHGLVSEWVWNRSNSHGHDKIWLRVIGTSQKPLISLKAQACLVICLSGAACSPGLGNMHSPDLGPAQNHCSFHLCRLSFVSQQWESR